MKKIILLALFLGFNCLSINAQVSVSFNIGTQPVWGPVGYDYARYYYLPDIDAYYDVNAQSYIYQSGRGWRHSRSLPSRYRNVDLYSIHKVVINDPNPWYRHREHVSQYGSYRGRHDQVAIRDSREEKYYENPNHPYHREWRGRGHDRNDHDNRGYHRNRYDHNDNNNNRRSDWHDRRENR